ncbi:cation diffusion facilitator family transporter [delta proteobacterium NaphS2]|nr:cation diffusion facilitator family transporter [delta proteobacterium NaphS2]
MMTQKEKIGSYSIGVNVLLVAMKGGLAVLSGSVALVADAIHSATDVISSVTVLAGIKISKRKSKNFPYGLYKVENFVSLLTSLFIFLAGYEIVKTVFLEPFILKRQYLPYAMAGLVAAMGITFAFSRYELRQGKAIGSPSLIADAKHIRTDMMSSCVILAGLVGGLFDLELDRIAAIVVVLLVFKAGAGIFVDAFRVLLDASLDFKTLDQVKTIILKNPRVVAINGLWGRNSGQYKFIEADIIIKAGDLEKAHVVSRRIENHIRAAVAHVDQILIHYAPQKRETRTIAIPLRNDRRNISEHFGTAPCFYVAKVRERDGVLLSEAYETNPFAGEEKGKGIKVSEWLLAKGVDTVYTPKGFEGKGPGYVFSDAGVDVTLTEDRNLAAIQLDMQKKTHETQPLNHELKGKKGGMF